MVVLQVLDACQQVEAPLSAIAIALSVLVLVLLLNFVDKVDRASGRAILLIA